MIMEGLKSKVQLSNKMSPNFPDKKGGLLGKMVTTGSDCPAHQLILPFNAPLSITSPHSTLFSIRRFYITFTPKTQKPLPPSSSNLLHLFTLHEVFKAFFHNVSPTLCAEIFNTHNQCYIPLFAACIRYTFANVFIARTHKLPVSIRVTRWNRIFGKSCASAIFSELFVERKFEN